MKNIIVKGKVIHGEHFGRVLGFPTANIDRRDYNQKRLRLRFGIYAGLVSYMLSAKSYKQKMAAIVIGPLDKRGLPKLEAHLLNFKGSLYGKKLVFEIQKFLRPWKKFKDMDSLKKQIGKDIQKIKKFKIK